MFTIEEFIRIPKDWNWFGLEYLLTDFGVRALKQNLITFEEAVEIPSSFLKELLTERGLQILERRLMLPKEIAKIPHFVHWDYLTSEFGLQALEKKLISVEEAIEMPIEEKREFSSKTGGSYYKYHCYPLQYLLSEWGLRALQENLISVERVKEISERKESIHHLKYLLSEKGVQALKEGLIKIEKSSHLSLNELQDLLIGPEERKGQKRNTVSGFFATAESDSETTAEKPLGRSKYVEDLSGSDDEVLPVQTGNPPAQLAVDLEEEEDDWAPSWSI